MPKECLMLNATLMESMTTNGGKTVAEISKEKPVLLVFLRHFGCLFCREALKDLSAKREEFSDKNINLIFVHMAEEDVAQQYFEDFGLTGVDHISDPECKYYSRFGLVKGTYSQLFGFKNWIRGVELTTKGIPFSLKQIGDGFQMPGIFMIRNQKVEGSFIHKSAADRPDYESIISCVQVNNNI